MDWKVHSIEELQIDKKMNLAFMNLKNISKDIQGYIILDKKSINFTHGNEISQEKITDEQGQETIKMGLAKKWGWIS